MKDDDPHDLRGNLKSLPGQDETNKPWHGDLKSHHQTAKWDQQKKDQKIHDVEGPSLPTTIRSLKSDRAWSQE